MPELPEVEVVRRGLADHVLGRTVTEVELRGHRVARRHVAGPQDLTDRLAGRRIDAVRRRGKYLWLDLGDSLGLILHLGMSGQLLVEDAAAPDEKHLHARFRFADDGPELRFVDQRTFGGLALADLDAHGIPTTIAHIAPDLLEPAYDRAAVVRRVKAKDSAIKRVLLDQTVASGIGNIYADEALWRAQGARRAGRQRADQAPHRRGARPRRAGDARGARRGRHQLRRALRQRQRRLGLLRPLAGRLRPGRASVPPVRHAHPARALHEPLVVLVPALPAPAPRAQGAGRTLSFTALPVCACDRSANAWRTVFA